MLGKTSRKIKYLVLSFIIMLSYQAVNAQDHSNETKGFYKSFKQDVTGDKKLDTIELKGAISDKNKNWVRALKLTVKSSEQTISVSLKSGSHPKIDIEDFNADGVKDVLVTVNKHNKLQSNRIYSFKGEQISKLELPPPVAITAQFLDDYAAEIRVENQKTVKVDIKSHKKYYEKLGIYDNGKLNEAMELIIDPYSEFKVGHKNELVGKQLVKGVDQKDAIATISTSWMYKDGNWSLQKVKVKPVKNKVKFP